MAAAAVCCDVFVEARLEVVAVVLEEADSLALPDVPGTTCVPLLLAVVEAAAAVAALTAAVLERFVVELLAVTLLLIPPLLRRAEFLPFTD